MQVVTYLRFLPAVACAALFAGMWCLAIAGHRLARRRAASAEVAEEDKGLVTGAIFAFLGLMIAFTFSNAFSRLEARRELIVQEVNILGTFSKRLDLLLPEEQPRLRELFRDYATSRAELYVVMTDVPAAMAELGRAAELQDRIWAAALAATSTPEERGTRILLLPVLNDMIDVTTTRTAMIFTHTQPLVFATLFAVALVCAALNGYGTGRDRALSRAHVVGFAAVTAFTMYVILDVEFPRFGLVRLDGVNQLLVDFAASLKGG